MTILRLSCALIGLAPLFAGAAIAQAAFITVYGGPTFDQVAGDGFRESFVPAPHGVSSAGVAVGSGRKLSANVNLGYRAFRLGVGGSVTELGVLGTGTDAGSSAVANAMNPSGTAVGYADKSGFGRRAVRWDAGGTAPTELAHLGNDALSSSTASALAINATGTIVGVSRKFNGTQPIGIRAVRWDAGGTAVTELGNLGTSTLGVTTAQANAVNAAGTIVGNAQKYVDGVNLGQRAARWNAGSTLASELGNLGVDAAGATNASALDADAAGNAVGYAKKYISGTDQGERAVRWDAGGTAATELATLGTSAVGYSLARALAVNASGTAVGFATEYDGGTYLGERAVRWEAGGTAATELGHLTPLGGVIAAGANAINSAGIIVGSSGDYTGGQFHGYRAMLWLPDGATINLNTLIDPASGWTLTDAKSISDTNFVAGVGDFDPDGAGPQEKYQRAFLLDATAAIPEPGSLALLAIAALGLQRRRRR